MLLKRYLVMQKALRHRVTDIDYEAIRQKRLTAEGTESKQRKNKMEKEISVVIDNEHNQLVVSSLQIAEDFGKQHKNVIQSIENLVAENSAAKSLFYETTYENRGKQYPMYLMNRDGFSLLVMGFTGKEAMNWKLKYIGAFNEMERQIKESTGKLPTSPREILKLIVQANEETDKKVEELREDVNSKFKEMPLFNNECQSMEKVVRKKGTAILGGYHSPAYNNRSTRQKVYEDIHRQIKQEFGVSSYKDIKREYHSGAMEIISNYSAPVVLRDEINRINNQQSMNLTDDYGTGK